MLQVMSLGLWGATGAALMGVWFSYLRGNHLIHWRRILPEMVAAVYCTGAMVEHLLPEDSFFICSAFGFFTGLASGAMLDVWRMLSPAFVRNGFNRLSKWLTGESLPNVPETEKSEPVEEIVQVEEWIDPQAQQPMAQFVKRPMRKAKKRKRQR